jgi:putative transposase
MRYIELNPVRANMVNHPGEYRWSSYGANAQGKLDRLIEPHPLYLELDSVREARLSAYRELFRYHVDMDILHEIRESLKHELVLGRSYFKDRIEQMTQRQTRPGKPERPRVEEGRAAYLVHY